MASLQKTGIGFVCAAVVGVGVPVQAWALGLGGASVPSPSNVNVPPPPSAQVAVPSPTPAITVPAPSPASVNLPPAPGNLPSPSAPTANLPAPSPPSTPAPSLPPRVVRVTTSPEISVHESSPPSPAISHASSPGPAISVPTHVAPSLGGGAPSATASPSVSSNGGLAGLAAALFGQGPGGGRRGAVGTSPLVRQSQREAERAFIAMVRRLSGCLTDLPYELRLVLQLSAGIGVSQPLSPTAVASHLHLSLRRLARLEKRALRQLLVTARTRGCGRGAEQRMFDVSVLGGFEAPFGGAAEVASGAVEAARYSKDPSRTSAGLSANQPPSRGDSLFATSPPEGQALLIVVLALEGVLLFGVVFRDRLVELGPPRWAGWRSKWTRRRRKPLRRR